MPNSTPQLVLQACLDAQADQNVFVTDEQIAEDSGIALQDVRDSLESLEAEKLVELARLEGCFKAQVSPKGRASSSKLHAERFCRVSIMTVPAGTSPAISLYRTILLFRPCHPVVPNSTRKRTSGSI